MSRARPAGRPERKPVRCRNRFPGPPSPHATATIRPLTETAKNHRMRLSRRDAWWAAGRLTEYRRARLKWSQALSLAQQYDVADSKSFPECDDTLENRLQLVDLWRSALVAQVLMPAPDNAAVAWKRVQPAWRQASPRRRETGAGRARDRQGQPTFAGAIASLLHPQSPVARPPKRAAERFFN